MTKTTSPATRASPPAAKTMTGLDGRMAAAWYLYAVSLPRIVHFIHIEISR
jgi:hypothetical protein